MMNWLTTKKWNGQLQRYEPLLRESVDDATALQLINKQPGKVPVTGFYWHTLETPAGTYNWGSACADMLGFIHTTMKN